MKKPTVVDLSLCGLGLLLSALSATDLCNTDGCSEAHRYTFFGSSFAVAGMAFFVLMALLYLAREHGLPRWPRLGKVFGRLLPVTLAGALGGEVILLLLQKNVIGSFCPLCLGIGAVIVLLAGHALLSWGKNFTRGDIMNWRTWGKAMIMLAAFAVGSVFTVAGTMKDSAAAQINPYIGKQDSKTEILIFTDWYCPGCRSVEPVLDALLPELTAKARVLYAAKIIHAEGLNFFPYEYYFSVTEKAKLLAIRKAFWEVSARTKNPTQQDILAALKPLGVTYHEPPFSETMTAMALYNVLSEQYEVKGTPTVVVRHMKTGKKKVLFGHDAITRQAILSAVKEVE